MSKYLTGEIFMRLIDSINANFLIMMLCYNYARYYHREKLSKVYTVSLCINSNNYMGIYNDPKIIKFFKV